MPVYEFYCRPCHVRLAFYSRRIDTETRPACPHCRTKKLQRQLSVFSVNRKVDTVPRADDAALRQVADRLSKLDESEHEATADLTAAMYETAGGAPGDAMQTALSRLRAGDDAVDIESELAADIDAEVPVQSPTTGDRSNASAEHQTGEPSIDPELYELLPEE